MTRRLPNKSQHSLGEDRRFHLSAPRETGLDELAKLVEPLELEMRALIEGGWSVLIAPTIRTLADAVEYEAVLTRSPDA